MITIIDTETKEVFVYQSYTDAAKKVSVQPATLRNWCKTKTTMKQRPWEVKDGFEIYFKTEFVKSNTGFSINPLVKF